MCYPHRIAGYYLESGEVPSSIVPVDCTAACGVALTRGKQGRKEVMVMVTVTALPRPPHQCKGVGQYRIVNVNGVK